MKKNKFYTMILNIADKVSRDIAFDISILLKNLFHTQHKKKCVMNKVHHDAAPRQKVRIFNETKIWRLGYGNTVKI